MKNNYNNHARKSKLTLSMSVSNVMALNSCRAKTTGVNLLLLKQLDLVMKTNVERNKNKLCDAKHL